MGWGLSGYDGDDLRVWKSESGSGGTTTYYLDDEDGSPIMELSSSGAVQAMNGFGPTGWVSRDYPAGSALASTFGAQDYSFTYDPEGNLVQRHPEISNGADALDTNVYDAYGNHLQDVATATGQKESLVDPVGFGGEYGYYFDKETSKSLLGHRYYDSAYGRFLNRDPIGYNGGINLYGYADNNPINGSDPSGFDNDGPEPIGPESGGAVRAGDVAKIDAIVRGEAKAAPAPPPPPPVPSGLTLKAIGAMWQAGANDSTTLPYGYDGNLEQFRKDDPNYIPMTPEATELVNEEAAPEAKAEESTKPKPKLSNFHLVDENVPKFKQVAPALRARGWNARSVAEEFGLGSQDEDMQPILNATYGNDWSVITRDINDWPQNNTYPITGGNTTKTLQAVMDQLSRYGY